MNRRKFIRWAGAGLAGVGLATLAAPLKALAGKIFINEEIIPHELKGLDVLSGCDFYMTSGVGKAWAKPDSKKDVIHIFEKVPVNFFNENLLEPKYQREEISYTVERFLRPDGNYIYDIYSPNTIKQSRFWGTIIPAPAGKDYREVRKEIVAALYDQRAENSGH
jgi:hypothetical protein